ncbi:uncharacterized protein LOC130795036 [Actinidia eriantha]|uniref:uncharacterized protein LOC130795036 n=1 Tax=Actinidia eriantha TaxID=165200 RepID=UPI002587DC84|nr:uncharacterized protein LOC130795036 [Actinidia eriantha]
MENGGDIQRKISAEDVISKLKNDGDFDRLRLKIIRKLKENEELRNGIVSMVKQSAALNHPGVENMKPRQLSDAIHQEVGDKVMNQISDSLWEIIRSHDGMKSEITETVESVYSKLLNPRGNEEGESSSLNSLVPVEKQADHPVTQTASPREMVDMSDNEPKEPPGFSLSNHHQNNHVEQPKEELQLPMPYDKSTIEEQSKEPDHPEDTIEADNEDGGPPGFSASRDGSDDDPDVPPGFG